MKRHGTKFLRLSLLLMATMGGLYTAQAQEQDGAIDEPQQLTMHSMMVGAGWSNILDSYLSPYNYKGTNISAMRETMRPTKWMDGKVYVQTLFQLDGSVLDNRAKTAKEYAGGVRYGIDWQYDVTLAEGLDLMAGTGFSGYLGGIYNDHNGNNPAQAKADLMIDLTAQALYRFRLLHRQWLVRYQVTVPFVGVAYSPHYGQSYYETFQLEHYDRNVQFAHFANSPSWRHLLTLSMPMRSAVLRVGVTANYQQAKLNGLKYHSYNTDILIGFSKYFYRKTTTKNNVLPF